MADKEKLRPCGTCNKHHFGRGTRLDLECHIAAKLMQWCPMVHPSHSEYSCRDRKHLRQARILIKEITRTLCI